MKKIICMLLIVLSINTLSANEIDNIVRNTLHQHFLPCGDEVFLRRTFLVLTGRLPKSDKAVHFLQSVHPEKRALLIDSLLDSDEYVRYVVM